MTKGEALQRFFSGFGLPAHPAGGVPRKAALPYLTYELVTAAWGDGEAAITVNLWYYTRSEAAPNAKAQELSEAIGLGGVLLPCDGGGIWLKRGAPWCQCVRDEADPMIKRRYLNVSAEYITLN